MTAANLDPYSFGDLLGWLVALNGSQDCADLLLTIMERLWMDSDLDRYDGAPHLIVDRAHISSESIDAAMGHLLDAQCGRPPEVPVGPLFFIDDVRVGKDSRFSCQFATMPYILDMYDEWRIQFYHEGGDDA